eukprot:768758-Hanusia_phi.AAC.3
MRKGARGETRGISGNEGDEGEHCGRDEGLSLGYKASGSGRMEHGGHGAMVGRAVTMASSAMATTLLSMAATKMPGRAIEKKAVKGKAVGHLYSDDNPGTTQKGTGFANAEAALRTTRLVEDRPPNKRIWTINTMLHRAKHHPHQTQGMRDAIVIFEDWIRRYKEEKEVQKKSKKSPSARSEGKQQDHHKELVSSSANAFSYANSQDFNSFLSLSRETLKEGKAAVRKAVEVAFRQTSCAGTAPCTIQQFTAVFGGPGVHGYGKHEIANGRHNVVIENLEELTKIVGKSCVRGLKEASSFEVTFEDCAEPCLRFKVEAIALIRARLSDIIVGYLTQSGCRVTHLGRSKETVTTETSTDDRRSELLKRFLMTDGRARPRPGWPGSAPKFRSSVPVAGRYGDGTTRVTRDPPVRHGCRTVYPPGGPVLWYRRSS